VVAALDIAHRQLVDAMPQVRQGPLDAAVTPGWIFFAPCARQRLDLLRHADAKLPAGVLPSNLLGDQPMIPAQKRLGSGDRGDLSETFPPQRVGECGERRRSVSVSAVAEGRVALENAVSS